MPKEVLANMTPVKLKTYYEKFWRTFQISDHLPLWVELKIDFSDEYLERMKKEEKTQPEPTAK